MDTTSLEAYLHKHIPISEQIAARVEEVNTDLVRLSAPLAANINHAGTAFGGSISMLAILAGWSLVHCRLSNLNIEHRLVIQCNEIDYLKPSANHFSAEAFLTDLDAWPVFLETLSKKGRARLSVSCNILCDGLITAKFTGIYVAIKG